MRFYFKIIRDARAIWSACSFLPYKILNKRHKLLAQYEILLKLNEIYELLAQNAVLFEIKYAPNVTRSF